MSAVFETSKGEIVFKLYCEDAPLACENFIELCKMKYFDNCLFHLVVKDQVISCGDPTRNGHGGSNIREHFFKTEMSQHLEHNKYTISMFSMDNRQEFVICRGEEFNILNGKITLFGHVTEGFNVVDDINDVYTDDKNHQNVRIKRAYVLHDPFEAPDRSPSPQIDTYDLMRIRDDAGKTEVEKREMYEAQNQRSNALLLEILDSLPDTERHEMYEAQNQRSNALLLEILGELPDEERHETYEAQNQRSNALLLEILNGLPNADE